MRFNKIENFFRESLFGVYEESLEKTKNLTLWAL